MIFISDQHTVFSESISTSVLANILLSTVLTVDSVFINYFKIYLTVSISSNLVIKLPHDRPFSTDELEYMVGSKFFVLAVR